MAVPDTSKTGMPWHTCRDLLTSMGPPATWHFNESYHGKGPMDGIGAVLKHNIYLAELRGRVTVNNANDFFDTAKNIIRNVTVLFRPKEEVEERGAKVFPSLGKCRCLQWHHQSEMFETVWSLLRRPLLFVYGRVTLSPLAICLLPSSQVTQLLTQVPLEICLQMNIHQLSQITQLLLT